jgi:hypothetical protein
MFIFGFPAVPPPDRVSSRWKVKPVHKLELPVAGSITYMAMLSAQGECDEYR